MGPTILYPGADELTGERFPLSATAEQAFAGTTGTGISDLSDPTH